MAVVLDGVLTHGSLTAAAAEDAADAATDLTDDVELGSLAPGRAEGRLLDGPDGTVVLTWHTKVGDRSGGGVVIGGSCPCAPRRRPGDRLCAHQVAVGLAALDDARERHPPTDAEPASATDRYLDGLDRGRLRDLVVELISTSDAARRVVEVRAAEAEGVVTEVGDRLVALARAALELDEYDVYSSYDYDYRYDDYDAPSGVVAGIDEVLDELETYLTGGSVEAVRPALFELTTAVRALIDETGDPDGTLDDVGRRAGKLYAWSCRDGSPDRVELARWLVRFRVDSESGPELELADFAAAFDDDGWAAYRAEVAEFSDRSAGVSFWHRYRADHLQLELADHDGDVDGAIRLLLGQDRPQYQGIVRRLLAHGRLEEVGYYVDHAVADAAVATVVGGSPQVLSAEWVARWYVDGGRSEDALALLRSLYAEHFSVAGYQQLLALADELGCRAAEQAAAWTLAEREAKRTRRAETLIQLALHEGDLDRAWAAADAYGAGHRWEALATASAATRPARALELYRLRVPDLLTRADKSTYHVLAKTLLAMRDLAAGCGMTDEVNRQIRAIREEYRRRPRMIEIFDRSGLTGR